MFMIIAYGILLAILFICGFIILGNYMERRKRIVRVYRSLYITAKFIFGFTLCGISILGCIGTDGNINIFFLLIYIAVFSLIKDIYTKVIVDRRNKLLQINLQACVERQVYFNDLFELEREVNEKENIKVQWLSVFSKEQEESYLGVWIKKVRYYFKPKNLSARANINYIIKQIIFHEKEIENIDNLSKLQLNIVDNKESILEYINSFVPYEKNDKKKYLPIFYNDTFFNLTAVAGYVVGNACINLFYKFTFLTVIAITFNIMMMIFFAIPFIIGVFLIIYEIVSVLRKY